MRVNPSWRVMMPVLWVLGLALVTMMAFRHQIFQGWTFTSDFLGTYTTTPAFVAATIGHGHLIPLDPFVASGFPVAVNPQAELYFPGWWLLGILDIPATLGVLTDVQVVHVFLGSCGVLALARARGMSWRWAFVAGLAYLFFGGFYGEVEHADIIRGFGYLPWLFWSLTPPEGGQRWVRLVLLPLLTWLIASGAYPSDLASFAIVGAVYLFLALRQRQQLRRDRAVELAIAIASSAAVCVAVLLPYFHASSAGDLFRPAPPTAANRAVWAITPDNFFGLYLNPFATQADGSVNSWEVGIPVLVGLSLVTRRVLRRQAPLTVVAVIGLFLAMSPKVGFIGRLMAGPLQTLFPSRFPAADYKAAIVIACIVLAVDAWRAVVEGETERRRAIATAVIASVALVLLAIVAPHHYEPSTRTLWLLILVAAGCAILACIRPKHTIAFVAILVMLVAVDGWRDARDVYGGTLEGTMSPWLLPSSMAPVGNRDSYIKRLPQLLAAKPKSRPARVPPAEPVSQFPGGSNSDALGWVADGYHLIDYGGTVEKPVHEIEENRTWTELFLEPWHAYVFPCSEVGCNNGSVHLPAVSTWTPSDEVKSLSYSTSGIKYSVTVKQPSLMVENELAIPGWQANNSRVKLVHTALPFRTWRLSPGTYEFTATYSQPTATTQAAAAAAAALLLIALGVVVWRQRDHNDDNAAGFASAPSQA